MRLLALLLFSQALTATQHHEALFRSLDPRSFSKQLAFYRLYPDTNEGTQAKERAASLLGLDPVSLHLTEGNSVDAIIGMFSGIGSVDIDLPIETVAEIEKAASRLPNRHLRGYQVETYHELAALPTEEVDVGRGLLLSHSSEERRRYEALLDLMALQIKASVGPATDPLSLVKAINQFLFYEMGFRFPPQSTFSDEIDRYTFLPSVLDGRRGVCLGVSLLYLCLAQRLNLPLEVITPPGHIYVRYVEKDLEVNIETTARGIDLPSWVYLGADTRKLQLRNYKEAIGMSFVNQAAVHWKQQDYHEALVCYDRAKPLLSDDSTLQMLQGFCFAMTNQEEKARLFLEPLRDKVPDWAVSPETMIADYLDGHADGEALAAAFLQTDEKESSITEKRKLLETTLKRCPQFRGGWFHLGACWMQQHRSREAIEALEKSWELGEHTATTAYLLAVLHANRYHFSGAWKFLQQGENLTAARDHHPRCLKDLRRSLAIHCPEPRQR